MSERPPEPVGDTGSGGGVPFIPPDGGTTGDDADRAPADRDIDDEDVEQLTGDEREVSP
jgi:hypothetical protein